MNEELQTKLLGILDKTTEITGSIADKLMIEAPELVKEILWYNGVISGMWFLLFLIIAIGLLLYEKKIWAWGIKIDSKEQDGVWLILPCLYSLVNFFTVIGVLQSITWIQILTAHRLYLLEYISRIIK